MVCIEPKSTDEMDTPSDSTQLVLSLEVCWTTFWLRQRPGDQKSQEYKINSKEYKVRCVNRSISDNVMENPKIVCIASQLRRFSSAFEVRPKYYVRELHAL